MSEIWACAMAEIRALGAWCFVHGPEFWLALVAWWALSIAILL